MEQIIRKDVPIALYYQVKEELRRKILSKEWKEGCKIPSEKDICTMFDVSRITVRKAIDELQDENYLVKKQGKGTFVKPKTINQRLYKFYSFSEELKTMGILESANMIEFSVITPNASLQEHLLVDAKEEVYKITRLRLMDNKAYAFEVSYIPVRFATELTEEMVCTNGLYKSLQAFDIYIERAQEIFSAVNLHKSEAMYMEADTGDAAIKLTRTSYMGNDVVEYCSSIVRGDVFHYTVELTT